MFSLMQGGEGKGEAVVGSDLDGASSSRTDPLVRDFASIATSSCDAISQYVDHEPFDTGRPRSALLMMDDDYALPSDFLLCHVTTSHSTATSPSTLLPRLR
jgi:hypothetical protein